MNQEEQKSSEVSTGEATQHSPKRPQQRGRNDKNRPRRDASSTQDGSKNSQRRGSHRGSYAPDETLKKFAQIYHEGQKQRLNPHFKLDLNTKERVRITPLGGLGEIGGNITVFETQNEAIVIDVGMSFPDNQMHGVDILVPDFSYIREIKDKIVAVIITHAHEDHIGAVPYLFKEMQFPIYGTPLPLAMIGSKFDEHQMREYRRYFVPVEKRKIYEIGNDFKIEWMHMTHSIIDSSTLAITTEAGTIIHTGDFKLDMTPVDGYGPDLHRLAHYGEQGVLCLLSDSTNSYNTAYTPSELSVAPALDRVFAKAEGRVLLSTFSSNIHRVYQAIQYGIKYGRKVCVIGRSMERNLEVAMQYDYIKLPKSAFIEPESLSHVNDKDVLIVTTGSQGEPSSALFRMSVGEHRHVKIKPNDLVILSSRAIPGNEASISIMQNHLQKAGAKVATDRDLHVSGHASIEEQKIMLRLVNPKFFLPVHGEYNHIMQHRDTAVACGVPERNIFLMDDGDMVEVSPKYMKKVKTIRSGKTYIDNQLNTKIEDDIVQDRQKLATDGVVIIAAHLADGKLTQKPSITTFGIISDKKDRFFTKDMEDLLDQYIINIKPAMLANSRAFESDLRQVVKKYIYKKMKKYPLISINIFLQ
ncbi:MAG: ribonuclease J [Sulfuricurvum sp.]